VRDRRSRGRSKSRASPVDRRRLGPGKATSCHDGGVEAVLAALAESVNHNALPRKERAPVSSGGCDRGVRGTIAEARGFGRERPHEAYTIRRSDAERRETLSSPVSMGGNHRVTPDEESVTLSWEEMGYGCSLFELWEAETRSDASRSRSTGSRKTTRASGT